MAAYTLENPMGGGVNAEHMRIVLGRAEKRDPDPNYTNPPGWWTTPDSIRTREMSGRDLVEPSRMTAEERSDLYGI